MPAAALPECSFFVPQRRDAKISDGQPHTRRVWRWLDDQLHSKFGGFTIAPGIYEGRWRSPTGRHIADQSLRYIVAVPREKVSQLRKLLMRASNRFAQRCIYLSVAGYVEFIG